MDKIHKLEKRSRKADRLEGQTRRKASAKPSFPDAGLFEYLQSHAAARHQRCWTRHKDLIQEYLEDQCPQRGDIVIDKFAKRIFGDGPYRSCHIGLAPFSKKEYKLITRTKRIPRKWSCVPEGPYFVTAHRDILNWIESCYWMYRYMMFSMNSHILEVIQPNTKCLLNYFQRLTRANFAVLNEFRHKQPRPMVQLLSTIFFHLRRCRKTKATLSPGPKTTL